MPAPFWNPERDQQLAALRAEGLMNEAIAETMGIHLSTVATRVRELKLPQRMPAVSTIWTDERNAKLRELWARRPMLSMAEIAEKLGGGIAKSSVSTQAGKLGLKGRLTPEVRHQPAPAPVPLYSRDRPHKTMTEVQLNVIATEAQRRPRKGPLIVYGRITGCTFIDPRGDGSRCGKGHGQTCSEHQARIAPLSRGALGYVPTHSRVPVGLTGGRKGFKWR